MEYRYRDIIFCDGTRIIYIYIYIQYLILLFKNFHISNKKKNLGTLEIFCLIIGRNRLLMMKVGDLCLKNCTMKFLEPRERLVCGKGDLNPDEGKKEEETEKGRF